jgi:hypothetical protein
MDVAGREVEFFGARNQRSYPSWQQVRKIEQLQQPFPADLPSLYGLATSVAIPALFVVLAQIPFVVVLLDLIKPVH